MDLIIVMFCPTVKSWRILLDPFDPHSQQCDQLSKDAQLIPIIHLYLIQANMGT